jgi:hypothetical protein
MPHWDRAGHFRTHEEIRQRAASRTESDRRRVEEEMRGKANMALQFAVVSGILLLSVVVGIHSSYAGKSTGKKRDRHHEG